MGRSSYQIRKCAFCGRRKTPESKIFLSRFPLDPDRCREWVRASGDEDLAYIPVEKLHQLRYVCEKHFHPRFFNAKRTRMLHSAIPNVNSPAKPLSDEILKDFPPRIAQDRLKKMHYKKALLSHIEKLPIVEKEHDYCPTFSILNFQPPSPELPDDDFLPAYSNPIPSTSNIHNNLKNTISSKPSTSTTSTLDTKPKQVIQSNPIFIQSNPSAIQSNPCAIQSNPSAIQSNPVPFKINSLSKENSNLDRDGHIMKPLQVKRLQKRYERINNELKELKKKNKLLKNVSSPVLKSFIESSITNNKRKRHGKRWTELNKTVALAIYKQSPKVYKYISQLLPFPSVKTLKKASHHIKINTCVDNNHIMNYMKKKAESLSDNEKICVILLNKMPLKKRLTYNTTTDKIDGYEDLGLDLRCGNIADHALVCMLQGICKNMNQPISHYFFKGAVPIERLANIIEKNIKAMTEMGYNIIGTVCDHGSTNVAALNLLRIWSNSPDPHCFYVDDKKVFIIYDVPHLFKSIRNNFLQAGQMIIDNKKGKWAHLALVEKTNQTSLRIHKITKLHIKPTLKSKMKVSHAVQTLSNTVAGVLRLLSQSIHHQHESGELMQTADVIEGLDLLFDCTNGPCSKNDIKKNSRENVRKNSFHHELWIEYKRQLGTFKFLNLDNRFILKNARCINGYRITLSSLQDVWSYMESKNIECLNLRRLNLDVTEKFFETTKVYPFNNPTCNQFSSVFRSSILTQLTAGLINGDDEEGNNKSLFEFQKLIFPKGDNTEKEIKVEEMFDIQKVFKDLDEQPVVYVSGYLASVLLKYESCQQCNNSIKISNPEENTMYDCNALRDWWGNRSCLTYPTEELCRTVDKTINIFKTYVQPNIYFKDILDFCKTEIRTKSDFSWICEEHKDLMIAKFLRRVSLLFFSNHCQVTNKLLMAEKKTTKNVSEIEMQNEVIVENVCEMNNIEQPFAAFNVYFDFDQPNYSEN